MAAVVPAQLFRTVEHYVDEPHFPLPRLDLGSSLTDDEEVLASLAYFGDVRDGCESLFDKHGVLIPDRDITFKKFQAFVRQAKSFFEASKNLHHRARPLLLYYAFLNLAKAYLALSSPGSVSGKIGHGITHAFDTLPLTNQQIRITGGVFPLLYRMAKGNQIAVDTTLSIVDLLNYCSDVGFELATTGLSDWRLHPSKAVACRSGQELHVVIAVTNAQRFLSNAAANAAFQSVFRAVSMPFMQASQMFGLTPRTFDRYSFFESVATITAQQPTGVQTSALRSAFLAPIANYCAPSVYEEPYGTFMLCRPIDPDLRFDELLGIYGITYWMGSLVRYFPDYFESVLSAKESWLIERFVHGVPRTALRHFSALILKENRVYRSR